MRDQKAVRGGRRARKRPPRAKRKKRLRCPTTGKVMFPDKAAAVSALAVMSRRPKVSGGKVPIRAYPCVYCQGWHLTSREKR